MSFGNFIAYFLFILFVYFFFVRPHVLKRHKFICKRCGNCCRLGVELSEDDIKILNKSGEKDFIERGNWLKRINGYCKFLEIKKGNAKCRVYNYRPKICQNWPLKKFSVDVRCRNYSKKWF